MQKTLNQKRELKINRLQSAFQLENIRPIKIPPYMEYI